MVVVGVCSLVLVSRARYTLPPLYRQINREDRLVVREGVCVLGARDHHTPTPTSITYTPSFLMAAYLYLQY